MEVDVELMAEIGLSVHSYPERVAELARGTICHDDELGGESVGTGLRPGREMYLLFQVVDCRDSGVVSDLGEPCRTDSLEQMLLYAVLRAGGDWDRRRVQASKNLVFRNFQHAHAAEFFAGEGALPQDVHH